MLLNFPTKPRPAQGSLLLISISEATAGWVGQSQEDTPGYVWLCQARAEGLGRITGSQPYLPISPLP